MCLSIALALTLSTAAANLPAVGPGALQPAPAGAAALASVAPGLLPLTSAAPPPDFPRCIEVKITADNSYVFGVGNILGMKYDLMTECNTTAGDIFTCPDGPETLGVCLKKLGLNDYFYIVAWGDDAVTNGVLASIRLTNVSGTFDRTRHSGHKAWQVYASGEDFDACVRPTKAEINAAVFDANFALGAAGTTSVRWVNFVPTPTGVLQVGEANNTDITDGTCNRAFPKIPCMKKKSRWMWYRQPGSTCAFTDGYQREFLVFRLPVTAFF